MKKEVSLVEEDGNKGQQKDDGTLALALQDKASDTPFKAPALAEAEKEEAGEEVTEAAKTPRKKINSKKRKSLRKAREREAAKMANSGDVQDANESGSEGDEEVAKQEMADTKDVSEAAAQGDAEPGSGTDKPRRKKLSSKQRKAREAEQQQLQPLPHRQEPHTPSQVPVVEGNKKVSMPKSPQQKGQSSSTADAVPDKAKTSTPLVAPHLSATALAALGRLLTVLHQAVQAEGQLACVNSGVTQAIVLREVTKLGYTCVEGRTTRFQHVQWNQAHNSFEVSGMLTDKPDKFPQTSKTKGDIKLLDPALFVRCRCIPAFGLESPEQVGFKVFQSSFLHLVEEVAGGESDAFVFAAAVSEYVDFVQQALPSLPLARSALSPPTTYALQYASKKYGACTLRCTVTTAEAVNNEIFYCVAIHA
jgi:hypothetical protein